MPTFTMNQCELRRKELEGHVWTSELKTNDASHLQMSALPVHGKNEIPSLK